MFNLIDRKIREAFSSAAMKYDALTSLHKEIGRELIRSIKDVEEAQTILDIGMGTGWFTSRLKFYFPEAFIVGIDFSSGMLEEAQKKDPTFEIVQGNAASLPFKKESFDLIVSNLAFQWVALPQGFQQCASSLKKGGTIAFTMFGFRTFEELFTTLEKTADKKEKLDGLARLPTKETVEAALRHSGFQEILVTQEIIKVRYPDMFGLLNWIKDIGANCLAKDIFIGKTWLTQANDYYDKNYKDRLGIYSTFEVLWINARK